MRKNNFPTGKLNEVPAEFANKIIHSLNDLYCMGKPSSDKEVKDRIDKYFEFCENSLIRPGVESLALVLGVSRQTLHNWQNGIGCSQERQDLIIRAKGFIISYIEQVMLGNRIYPGSAIFLLKNWGNYRDTLEFTTEQNTGSQTPALSQEDIKQIAEQAQKKSIPELIEGLPDE